jgi:succinate dehydrogenase/fumarate reductase flavoprotein subunit
MIITGALARQESRGLHYNLDHPDSIDDNLCNFIQRNGRNVHKDLLANISFTW